MHQIYQHQFHGRSSRPTTKDKANQKEKDTIGETGHTGEMNKLNQIVQHYYLKAVLVVLRSRVDLPCVIARGTDQKKVDRWFNLEIDDTNALRDALHIWRTIDLEHTPSCSPLYLETYLDASDLLPNQSLVILDSRGRRWDALEGLYSSVPALQLQQPADKRIILERWKVELANPRGNPGIDRDEKELSSILPTLYKKLVLVFRALFTYARYLPAYNYARKTGKIRGRAAGTSSSSSSTGLKIRWRVVSDSSATNLQNLQAPLYKNTRRHARGYGYHYDSHRLDDDGDDEEDTTSTFTFGPTESPAGLLNISVAYRVNCDFRVDDSEALLSSRFMGADVDDTDILFEPSLPPATTTITSSAAPTAITRTSTADDDGGEEGSQSASGSGIVPTSDTTRLRTRTNSYTRRLVEESHNSPQRRPSFTFPVFKTPTLSSSPKRSSQLSNVTSDQTGSGSGGGGGSGGTASSRPASRGTLHNVLSEGAKAREIPFHLKRASTTQSGANMPAPMPMSRPQTATSISSRRGGSAASNDGGIAASAGAQPSLHGSSGLSTQIQATAGLSSGGGGGGGGAAAAAAVGGVSPSTSAGSSKPKYSSSFSHRRSRLSLCGMSLHGGMTDDVSNAPLSRRASQISIPQGRGQSPISGFNNDNSSSPFSQQFGSTYNYDVPGMPQEFAASLGSIHADEENISDFLRLLESSKDLMKSGLGNSTIQGGNAGAGNTASAVVSPGNARSSQSGDDASSAGDQPNMTSSSSRRIQQPTSASQIIGGATTVSALDRFHNLRESNQRVLDSMSNSFLLQQRPTTASSSSPRQHLLLQNQTSQAYSATANSPATAMGVVGGMSASPHTPAIPSRLSAASNIDYGDDVVGPNMGTSADVGIPPPMTAPETEIDVGNAKSVLDTISASSTGDSSLENKESINETTAPVSGTVTTATATTSTAAATAAAGTVATPTTTANALPINIPSSLPRRFMGSPITYTATSTHRRPVSAAPKPRQGRSRDSQDSEDYLPFIKTLSLGNEDAREPPSLGDLLRGRPGARGGGEAASSAEAGEVAGIETTGGDTIMTTAAGGCSRATPDLNSAYGGNGVESSKLPSSSLSSGLAASDTAEVDKTSRLEVGPPAAPSASESSSLYSRPLVTSASTLSGIAPATAANRRSAFLPQRPSFHRPPTSASRGHGGSLSMQMQQGSAGSLDEDEPLLFVMTDVGATRRSLEEKERRKENERGEDASETSKAKDDGAGADVDMAEQMEMEGEN